MALAGLDGLERLAVRLHARKVKQLDRVVGRPRQHTSALRIDIQGGDRLGVLFQRSFRGTLQGRRKTWVGGCVFGE